MLCHFKFFIANSVGYVSKRSGSAGGYNVMDPNPWPGGDELCCSECDYTTKNKTYLRQHMNKHQEGIISYLMITLKDKSDIATLEVFVKKKLNILCPSKHKHISLFKNIIMISFLKWNHILLSFLFVVLYEVSQK